MKTSAASLSFKYTLLLFASLIVFFPLYILFINSFKGSAEYGSTNIFTLPRSFMNFENFKLVFERAHLDEAFLNTVIVIGLSLIGNILLGTMVSYVLGRFEFKGRKLILGLYAGAVVIPAITTQVAVFSIIRTLGLFNTHFAPVLLYIGADVIQIYILLQFIRNIPYELDESAMIEGVSLFGIFYRIIVPLLTPAISTLIILKTISIYNDMYTPYLYMPAQRLGVVSTTLMKFTGNNSAEWQLISAAILVILLPTVLLYLFLQRYIFSGITSGAVK
ncbi:carbohydrate ABC transporter permease [Cohnella lupini]|uniref:Multiple sugar transport system permease protein n=1 Tax=Cohnella lupini TaxID=1294267 RepID=A0A3D9IA26_9BACL|nr:carbohydrate ABC transporter permease [Cohnella lupini]RED58634.1 multiple sugar transport system permease protein [Cohnella lupini]